MQLPGGLVLMQHRTIPRLDVLVPRSESGSSSSLARARQNLAKGGGSLTRSRK
jgi:hypothetical protein